MEDPAERACRAVLKDCPAAVDVKYVAKLVGVLTVRRVRDPVHGKLEEVDLRAWSPQLPFEVHRTAEGGVVAEAAVGQGNSCMAVLERVAKGRLTRRS